MKKLNYLSIYLVLIILFVGFHSCKKDEKYKNVSGEHIINNLPVADKIQSQEIADWLSAQPLNTSIQPQWANATQFTVNGEQVVQIPIGKDAALFVTKPNGVLNVSAYKWLDKTPGASLFTGKVAIFSFLDNSLKACIYNKGKLIKSNVLNSPVTGELLTKTGGPQLKVTSTESTSNFVGAILCWVTGGKWTGFQTNWCDYSESIWVKIATFLSSIFGGDDSGGGEDVGFGGDGSSINDGGFGDSFSGSYGTSDGGSVSISYGGGGASVYVTVNPPCSVSGGSTPISVIDDDATGCGGVTTQIIPYPVDAFDTFTGDEPDEAADNNIVSNHIPVAHIPTTITLTNGQTVSVLFGTTSDGQSADQEVSSRLIATLTQALNIASQTVTITSIYIKASTNGAHSSPNSNHYKGLALDISRINGVAMSQSGNTAFIQALQNAFDQSANIRENFGPYFKHKFGQPFTVNGHDDHIHVSVNGN